MVDKIKSTKKKSNFSEEQQKKFDEALQSKEIESGAVFALNTKSEVVSYVLKGDSEEVKQMVHSTLILPDLLESHYEKDKKTPHGKSMIGIPGWLLSEVDMIAEQSVKNENDFSAEKTSEAFFALSEMFKTVAENIQKYSKKEGKDK